jgi:hypothetical protein
MDSLEDEVEDFVAVKPLRLDDVYYCEMPFSFLRYSKYEGNSKKY